MTPAGEIVPREKVSENTLARLYLGQENSGRLLLVYALRRSYAENAQLIEKLQALSAVLSSLSDPALARHAFFRASEGKLEWADEVHPGVSLVFVQKLLDARELELQVAPVLRLFEDLARALGVLHRAGMSFGFLCPEHVWLSQDGQGLLWANGIEAALLSIKSLFKHQVLNRRQHLAPEIARGRPPSPAADVYSLASLAYFFVTGRNPGADSSPSVSTRHQAIVPPSHLNRKLAFACDAVFIKALSANPSSRPADGDELAEALRKLRATLHEGKDTSGEQLAGLARNLMAIRKQRGQAAVDFLKEPEPAAISWTPKPVEESPEANPEKETCQPQASETLYQEAEPDTRENFLIREEETPTETEVPSVQPSGIYPSAPAVQSAEDSRSELPNHRPREAQTSVSLSSDTLPCLPAAEPKRKNRLVWLWPAGAGVLLLGALFFCFSADRGERQSTEKSPIGFVSVTSSVECRITIDGVEQGICPLQFKPLPTGHHRLVVRNSAGRVLLEQEIELQAGDHHRFYVTELEPPSLERQQSPAPVPEKQPLTKNRKKKSRRR